MYIQPTRTYYQGTELCASRGLFLILCHPKLPGYKHADYFTETRALVRKVALRQCGHWMMGTARAYGHSLTLSGSYGADGLILEVPQEVYDRAFPVPRELMEAANNGGGWNSAGSKADLFRKWALNHLPELTGKVKVSV